MSESTVRNWTSPACRQHGSKLVPRVHFFLEAVSQCPVVGTMHFLPKLIINDTFLTSQCVGYNILNLSAGTLLPGAKNSLVLLLRYFQFVEMLKAFL